MHDILPVVKRHDMWRGGRCINLIPSENCTSPAVQQILGSDMGRRYTLPLHQMVHGSLVDNAYRGTRYLDEVEALGERTALSVFEANHASLKPLSGHVAALTALVSTCRRGDLILTIGARFGGYDGYMPDFMPSFLGLKVGYLPFDARTWNLDVEASAEAIARRGPRAVVVGSSFILFPYELRKLKRACRDAGALLLYDASHVLGLAPWNFQHPLKEGVDLLYGSTHKSFFGPQGGLMLTKDKGIFDRVLESTTWKVLDNAHWNRIAALAQALLEYERFGRKYGAQVLKNAGTLAEELSAAEIRVRFEKLGYTRSHMLLLDHRRLRSRHGLGLNGFAARLERSNIIVDAVGRIGLNEITRSGADEGHMVELAGLLKSALKRNVRDEVVRLRRGLRLSFC